MIIGPDRWRVELGDAPHELLGGFYEDRLQIAVRLQCDHARPAPDEQRKHRELRRLRDRPLRLDLEQHAHREILLRRIPFAGDLRRFALEWEPAKAVSTIDLSVERAP